MKFSNLLHDQVYINQNPSKQTCHFIEQHLIKLKNINHKFMLDNVTYLIKNKHFLFNSGYFLT
jgi:hypothetical protein